MTAIQKLLLKYFMFNEQEHDIMKRVLRFLSDTLKLQNAPITQEDCLTYLKNDTDNKVILLYVPYIGSSDQCAVDNYNYDEFHKKVADFLQQSKYPFIYYCRSSGHESDKSKSQVDKEKIIKMKLGQYFLNRGFYLKKVHLEKDTEIMISNVLYSESQFQWNAFCQSLL